MEKKRWFTLTRESVSTSRNNIIFQELDFPVSTSRKSPNKRILFKLNGKSEISEKSKKTVANSSNKSFK